MDWTEAPERPRISQTKIVFGLVVMAIGLLLLSDRMSWWGFRWNVPLWPWILIAIGLSKFSDRPIDERGRLRGRLIAEKCFTAHGGQDRAAGIYDRALAGTCIVEEGRDPAIRSAGGSGVVSKGGVAGGRQSEEVSRTSEGVRHLTPLVGECG